MYNDHRSINPAVVLCYIDNGGRLGICPPKDPLYKIHVKRVHNCTKHDNNIVQQCFRYAFNNNSNNDMCSCVGE